MPVVVTLPPTRMVPVAFEVREASGIVPPTAPENVVWPFVLTVSVRPAAFPFTVLPKMTLPPVPRPALPPDAVTVVLADSSAASATVTVPPDPAVPVPERLPPVVVMFA